MQTHQPLPAQQFDVKREKPGSGVLLVSVEHDGPTRVLSIVDSGSEQAKEHDRLKRRCLSFLSINRFAFL